jgi:hypothetical protein
VSLVHAEIPTKDACTHARIYLGKISRSLARMRAHARMHDASARMNKRTRAHKTLTHGLSQGHHADLLFITVVGDPAERVLLGTADRSDAKRNPSHHHYSPCSSMSGTRTYAYTFLSPAVTGLVCFRSISHSSFLTSRGPRCSCPKASRACRQYEYTHRAQRLSPRIKS